MSDPRDQRIAELEAENAALRARTAELEKKVEDLTQLVLMLKERLDRNSGNSSKPPSSDSPDQRSERRGKGPTGGSRGGQPGHTGSKRDLLPKEQVNEFNRGSWRVGAILKALGCRDGARALRLARVEGPCATGSGGGLRLAGARGLPLLASPTDEREHDGLTAEARRAEHGAEVRGAQRGVRAERALGEGRGPGGPVPGRHRAGVSSRHLDGLLMSRCATRRGAAQSRAVER